MLYILDTNVFITAAKEAAPEGARQVNARDLVVYEVLGPNWAAVRCCLPRQSLRRPTRG